MAAFVTTSIAVVLKRHEKLNEFALAVQMCDSGQYKYTRGITSTVYSNRCTSATGSASSPESCSLDLGGESSCPLLTPVQGDHQKHRLRPHLRHHLRPLVPLPTRPDPLGNPWPLLPYNTSPSQHSLSFSPSSKCPVANNPTSSSLPSSATRRSWSSHHSSHNNNNSTHSHQHHNKYPSHHYSSVLVSWIILIVFSTTIVLPIMAAPIGSPSTTPKWVNPCGVNPDQVLGSHEVEIPPLKPSELYNNIALQAKLAMEQANEVSTQYVLEAFHDPEFPNYSKELSYKWLPIIPEPTPEHVEGLVVEGALRSSYEYLQFYAVGLEQIVLDQIVYEGIFLDEFRQMEGKLRQVLCEIQLAMLEMKVKQNPDVTREVMAQEFRDMDSKTARDLRDWIILRDYIGCLNYISTVFAHFKAKADIEDASS